MTLIDRYVKEIGKRLPRKNRKDIEAELQSTLEDMLEDRAQETGQLPDEALATKLLLDYGSPNKVAATYQTHPYLIGPEMFPTYSLVMKIVLFAVALGLTIATIIALITSSMTGPDLLRELGEFVGSLVTAMAAAFGNVTLVFAILERALPPFDLDGEEEEWSPAELSKAKGPNHVSRGDMIASLVFTAIVLILLNFYPHILGAWNMEDGEWVRFVSISESFFRLVPWITLIGLLTISLNIWLLRRGNWTSWTRLADIGLKILSIGVVIAVLRGPDLLIPEPNAAFIEISQIIANMGNTILPFLLLLSILGTTVEIGKSISKLIQSSNPA